MTTKENISNKLIEIYNQNLAPNSKNICICIKALGKCGGNKAAKALISIYNSNIVPITRNICIEALGNCGKKS